MAHVITVPPVPFLSSSGGLTVHALPSATDNLIWVVEDAEGWAWVIDGPDAGPLRDWLGAGGRRLSVLSNTHVHPDHIGINRDLLAHGELGGVLVLGPGALADRVPGLTRAVGEGDRFVFGGRNVTVWLTEGHVDGHCSFLVDDLLFCGDTMFAGGCGRIFEGPPARLYASLLRLGALPPETRVCCAHEYTWDNLKFAWWLSQDDVLAERITATRALRSRGEATVPSTIAMERATNPYLRVRALRPAVEAILGAALGDDAEVFAAIRRFKDEKRHKDLSDADLP